MATTLYNTLRATVLNRSQPANNVATMSPTEPEFVHDKAFLEEMHKDSAEEPEHKEDAEASGRAAVPNLPKPYSLSDFRKTLQIQEENLKVALEAENLRRARQFAITDANFEKLERKNKRELDKLTAEFDRAAARLERLQRQVNTAATELKSIQDLRRDTRLLLGTTASPIPFRSMADRLDMFRP